MYLYLHRYSYLANEKMHGTELHYCEENAEVQLHIKLIFIAFTFFGK